MTFMRSGVELVLDERKFDLRNLANKAKAADSAIDGITDAADRAGRALSGIDGNVSIKANVDDSELRSAVDYHNELNSNTSMKADADGSELDAVKATLEEIRALAVIDIVMNVAGMAGGAGELPIISSLIEVDNALAQIEGRTGGMIPNAEYLIQDLYTNAWGESRDAIGEVIIQADNLRISQDELASAVTTAFQVADTGIGDTNEILRAMDSIVKNELAPDFQTAGDILVTGLQNGADRGQDLLDTFNEYGSTFNELNISAEGALGLIVSGLEAGVDNSDRIADNIRETGILLRQIGTNEGVANAFSRLDSLSSGDLTASLDAFNAGAITGDEFFEGFFSAISEVHEDDAQAAAEIFVALGGTITEDFGPSVVSQLTPQWDEAMGELEGRAETASNAINNTLGTSITGLARTIEDELVTTLDESFDLSGMLDNLKSQITTFASELRSGSGVGEALEVSFGLTGVDTFVANFERIIGNLEIVFLEVVRDLGNLLGKDTSGISTEITRLAEGQLAFDLKVANPDEVAGIVQTAIDRGVDAAAVGEAYGTAIEEALAAGDVELAARLSTQAGAGSSEPIIIRGIEFAPGSTPEDVMAEFETIANQFRLDSFGLSVKHDFESGDLGTEIQAAFGMRGGTLTPELQTQIDAAGTAARAAFFTAMESGNIGEALDIGAALDDPALISRASQAASEMFLAAQEAYNNFDFSTLNTLATQLDDPALKAQAEDLGAFLREQFAFAQGEGDITAAKQIAADLGDPALLEAMELYKTSGKTAADDVRVAVETSEQGIAAAFQQQISDMAEQKPYWTSYAESAITEINRIAERLIYVKEQTMGLTAELGAGAASTGIGATGGGFASGGTTSGTQLVGEHGAELATFPSPAGIINAANTGVLMNAVSSVLDALVAGSGGQTTVNNYFTMNNSNHMQNGAQADAFGARAGIALRGF